MPFSLSKEGSHETDRAEHLPACDRLRQSGSEVPGITDRRAGWPGSIAGGRRQQSDVFRDSRRNLTRGISRTWHARNHVGRWGAGDADRQVQMHSVSTGTFPEPVATGPWVFTAADGSQLFAEIAATGEPIGEFTDRVTNLGKITGGTGRFGSATGQFTAVLIATRDESTRTGTFSGSFEGRLNLNR